MKQENIKLLSSAYSGSVSSVILCEQYNSVTFQLSGSFTGAVVVIEGRTDIRTTDWEIIAVWSVEDNHAVRNDMREAGIYECAIEGIRELRARVLALDGGSVSLTGIFCDISGKADGESLLRSNLFVKGFAEILYIDPSNGNLVGRDTTGSNSAATITTNYFEQTGGFGNKLQGVIADTSKISGTYTAEAFSLKTRELITNGKAGYGAAAPVCETNTAENGILRIKGNAVHAYGQPDSDALCCCYVREKGTSSWGNVTYGINSETGIVEDFIPTDGKSYDVMYYVHHVSAYSLMIPDRWNPVVLTIHIKYGVYSQQRISAMSGVQVGWLYLTIPSAILTSDAGVNAGQTSNGQTGGDWKAIPQRADNLPMCDCGTGSKPIAYYTFVPCGDETQNVTDLVVIGSGLTLNAGKKDYIPVKYVMDDNTLVIPDYTRLGYVSENEEIATVDMDGKVRGISEGSTIIRVFLTKQNGTFLTAKCPVTVVGTLNKVKADPSHIIL